MKFDEVQKIFYHHIHRRYHRFCRELFAQFLCLYLNIKSAYLFDLFPFSIENMRSLLNSLSIHLPFRSIILKYSLNDLIIVNTSQLEKLIHASVHIIDLTTMTIADCHPMLDKIRNHLSWINSRQIDFDNETNKEWSDLIQSLNHTTVFGYLLGYPLIYFYSSTTLIDVNKLKNFRLYIKINVLKDEILLYSFSCPIHLNINQEQIESIVDKWFSCLSLKMNAIDMINNYHLEKQIREESTWCL